MYTIFYKRFHPSWLIAVFCVAFTGGVYLAVYLSAVHVMLIGMAGVSCVLAFVWRNVFAVGLLILAGIVFGLLRGGLSQLDLDDFRPYYGESVVLAGKVYDDPDIPSDTELRLKLAVDSIDDRLVSGKVWLSTVTGLDIRRGDQVKISGLLSEGFGSFAGSLYRAKVVGIVRPEPGDFARVIRDTFADKVREVVAEPQASLGVGYLVGQKSALPPDLNEALKISGLTHIVVASGYNLTILVRLARRLFQKVSKFLSAWSSGVMIVMFVAVTGLSPSMSRAGLVAGLSLLAWYYGRNFHPLVLLPLVAAVTVAYDPNYIWGDLGWQLSFAAFFGVMVIAPLLQSYFFGDKKPGVIRQVLGETISAQIATAPMIILQFGVISNVAILANLLVLPLVPLAMLLTFLTGVSVLIAPFVSGAIGWLTGLLLGYMTTVTYYLAGLNWAQGELEISWWAIGLTYLVMAIGCFYLWKKTKYNFHSSSIVD